MQIERMKKRPDFQKVTKRGSKFVAPSLVMLAVRRKPSDKNPPENVVRLGFTVSKKVGNAVCRNRARRRLKEASNKLFSELAVSGCDYVIIGRKVALERDFADILDDMQRALVYLAKRV
jgi:ribonuclease P protein component